MKKNRLFNWLVPIWLLWTYTSGKPVVFEIWHSTDLINWTELTETADTKLQLAPRLQSEFFKVRARDTATGLTSDWATQ